MKVKKKSRIVLSLSIIILTIIMMVSSYFIYDIQNSFDDYNPNFEKRMILNLDGFTNISNLFSPSENYVYTGNSFYFDKGEDNYYVMQLPVKQIGFYLSAIMKIQNSNQYCNLILRSADQEHKLLIIFNKTVTVNFYYYSELMFHIDNIKVSDISNFFFFEIYLISESIVVKINSKITEKENFSFDFDFSFFSLISFSLNLEIQTISMFTYINKQNRSEVLVSFQEFIEENTMYNLKFQNEDGSFISGYDAYGDGGYELVSSSLMLVKMFQTFELTNNFSLLPLINKTVNFLLNDSLISYNEYGYYFKNGTSLINDIARPLFGLVYIGIKQAKLSTEYFPQIEKYLDKFVLSKKYNIEEHYWYSNEQNINYVINQQMQASTTFYLWAKYRNFENVTLSHRDFILNYLLPSQKEDGCWFYSLTTKQSTKPLFIVYMIHNLYNLALMKHFYPNDLLWENPQIDEMLSKLIPWMEGILPSFAYFADYYSNLNTSDPSLSTNSGYENEPHHILGYASLGCFPDYEKKNLTDWALQAFFDTFITLNMKNYKQNSRLSENFLSDALAYRWLLYQDLQKEFLIYI